MLSTFATDHAALCIRVINVETVHDEFFSDLQYFCDEQFHLMQVACPSMLLRSSVVNLFVEERVGYIRLVVRIIPAVFYVFLNFASTKDS